MKTDTYTQIAETLVDKDKYTAPDGTLLRLVREPDYDSRISDYDCYGLVAQVEKDRDTGLPAPRPDMFDGSAEKIVDAWGNAWWWQPTPERFGWTDYTDENRALDRACVLDVINWGFETLTVEVCRGVDFYGRPIVVHAASIAGVEAAAHSNVDYDIASIVADILSDIDCEYGLTVAED